MQRQVLKYPLNQGRNELPRGRVVLIAEQHRTGWPTAWIEHDQLQLGAGTQVLEVYGTGHSINDPRAEHVGSAVCEPFVWHVYRVQP